MPGHIKAKYILLMGLVYLGLYTSIQVLVTAHEFDFLTRYDKLIPFLPEHIWLYHTILPVILLTMFILVKTKRIFFITFWACAVSAVLLNISYVCFPSFYPRPEFDIDSISKAMVYITYQIDGSNNTFPSGHVAFAWIIFFGAYFSDMAKNISGLRCLYFLWAVGLSLSTLTLKQHYIVDVFSGILLGATSFYISFYMAKLYADHLN